MRSEQCISYLIDDDVGVLNQILPDPIAAIVVILHLQFNSS